MDRAGTSRRTELSGGKLTGKALLVDVGDDRGLLGNRLKPGSDRLQGGAWSETKGWPKAVRFVSFGAHPCDRKHQPKSAMPKYVIEREIPGAGSFSSAQLQGASKKSCDTLESLGPKIQWLHSYVTDDKLYCVYIAPDEALIREHAQRGGFPANRISEVKEIIDPTTAEV